MNHVFQSVEVLLKIMQLIDGALNTEQSNNWVKSTNALATKVDDNLRKEITIYNQVVKECLMLYEDLKVFLPEFNQIITELNLSPELNNLAMQFREIKEERVIDNSHEVCHLCNVTFSQNSIDTSLICHTCGLTQYRNILDTDNIKVPKTNNNINNAPARMQSHLKDWLNAIQGDGIDEVPTVLLQFIRKKIIEDHVILLTVMVIRSYMKLYKSVHKSTTIRVNEHYKHAPAVIYWLRNQVPEKFTNSEQNQLTERFGQVYRSFNEVNKSGSNFSYFPYFIYKMIEVLFNDNSRRSYILSMIMLQTMDTNEKNDITWAAICEKLDMTYIPTYILPVTY